MIVGFRPGLGLTAQAAFALVTVLGLAYWQFSRGIEKADLAAARDENLAAPSEMVRLSAAVDDFRRVRLTGRYDPRRSFLAFAIRAGRPGYDVYTRFVSEGTAFVVHRGWAPSPSREGLPSAEPPPELVEITGVVWPIAEVAPAQRQKEWPAGWPKRIGVVDIERMAEQAGTVPREVRLDPEAAGVLAAPSLYYDYSSGTHWSYMVQWLLFGVAIVVGFVLIGRRQARQQNV